MNGINGKKKKKKTFGMNAVNVIIQLLCTQYEC